MLWAAVEVWADDVNVAKLSAYVIIAIRFSMLIELQVSVSDPIQRVRVEKD